MNRTDFQQAISQTKHKLTTTGGYDDSYIVDVKREIKRLGHEYHCNTNNLATVLQMVDDRQLTKKKYRIKNGSVRTILSTLYQLETQNEHIS